MGTSQFAMWLQGFAELNAEPPTKEQWQSIREHLQLVFRKVTPEVKSAEPKKPTIDVSANEVLRRMLEDERKKQAYQPFHYRQPYSLDGMKPGDVYC